LALFGAADDFVLSSVKAAIGSGIKIAGKTYPIEVIAKDTQSSVNRASDVTNELILNAAPSRCARCPLDRPARENYADVTEVIREFMKRGIVIRTVIKVSFSMAQPKTRCRWGPGESAQRREAP
jgi:hypothetical protein